MEIPRHHRLKLQRYGLVGEVCPACDKPIFPPRDICPSCSSVATKENATGIVRVVYQANHEATPERLAEIRRDIREALGLPNE